MPGRFVPLRLLGIERSVPRWPTLNLQADGLLVRPPEQADFIAWSSLRAISRDFLEQWEPRWPEDDLTHASFRYRIRRYHKEIERDEAYPFFIFREADNTLLGGLTLSNVRRGAAQTATLGYWMGAPYAGKGIMLTAVRLVTRHAFERMRLMRIEAACMPENQPSMGLLEKAGFEKEGFARSYLNINGQRRDHVLYALFPNARTGQKTGNPQ